MSDSVRVVVMTLEQYREWRGDATKHNMLELVRERGEAPLRFTTDSMFYWTCPGCGGTAAGTIGDVPIGGWGGDQQWTREGDDEHLTLTPSLGCPGWRDGVCVGHWWLRAGHLVLA